MVKRANAKEVMEAKWAINYLYTEYGDKSMYVDEVVDFMDVKPRKGVESDAVKKGAEEYLSEFGEHIQIIGKPIRSNPMKRKNPKKNCRKNEKWVYFPSTDSEVCFPRKRRKKPTKRKAKGNKRTVRKMTRTTKVSYGKKKRPKTKSKSKARKRAPAKPVSVPKGKRKGDHFTKNGKHYTVVSFIRDGKRVRYARQIGGGKCPVKKSGGKRRNPPKKNLTKAAYRKEVNRIAKHNLPYVADDQISSYINNDVDHSPLYRDADNHDLIIKHSRYPSAFEDLFLEDEIADRLAEDGPEGILDDRAYHAMREDVEEAVYVLSQKGR